jgi:phenylalanyl-tRNA synthetase alpha subunit
MDLMIRKFSRDHFLTILQFLEAARMLRINTGAYTAHDFETAPQPAKRIVNFYNLFREKRDEDSEPKFRQYDMIILGVFLSSGSAREKAEVLFDNFDIEFRGSLNREEVVKMWEDVYQIVGHRTFLLSYDGDKETGKGFNQLESYMNDILKGKDAAIAHLDKIVFPRGVTTTVTKEEFINRISQP